MWFFVLFCLVMVTQTLSLDGNADSRVIGGQKATIRDYPYQVSLRFPLAKRFCGGFIIGSRYILTAAHCIVGIVSPPYNETVIVRAGSYSKSKGGTIITIADLKSHPRYGSTRDAPFDNDVTYMKTSEPIVFTKTVKAIRLPSLNRNVTGNVIVAGWGRTKDGSPNFPDELMAVRIPVISQKVCKKEYGKEITDNMWCGGNIQFGGVGNCQGDSGGAAIQNNMAVGIVSFGRVCGAAHSPTVYTNIASPSVRNFIKKNTNI